MLVLQLMMLTLSIICLMESPNEASAHNLMAGNNAEKTTMKEEQILDRKKKPKGKKGKKGKKPGKKPACLKDEINSADCFCKVGSTKKGKTCKAGQVCNKDGTCADATTTSTTPTTTATTTKSTTSAKITTTAPPTSTSKVTTTESATTASTTPTTTTAATTKSPTTAKPSTTAPPTSTVKVTTTESGTSETCYDARDKGTSSYRGTKSTTKSGRTCQKWTEQKPHSHTMKPEKYPDGGLGDHNYCRRPYSKGQTSSPWCYTTDKKKRFEECGIPFCQTCVAKNEKPCLFPFKDGNKEYNECADHEGKYFWCATSINSAGKYTKWSECPEDGSCPGPETTPVTPDTAVTPPINETSILINAIANIESTLVDMDKSIQKLGIAEYTDDENQLLQTMLDINEHFATNGITRNDYDLDKIVNWNQQIGTLTKKISSKNQVTHKFSKKYEPVKNACSLSTQNAKLSKVEAGDGRMFDLSTITKLDTVRNVVASAKCCSACKTLRSESQLYEYFPDYKECDCYTTISDVTPITMPSQYIDSGVCDIQDSAEGNVCQQTRNPPACPATYRTPNIMPFNRFDDVKTVAISSIDINHCVAECRNTRGCLGFHFNTICTCFTCLIDNPNCILIVETKNNLARYNQQNYPSASWSSCFIERQNTDAVTNKLDNTEQDNQMWSQIARYARHCADEYQKVTGKHLPSNHQYGFLVKATPTELSNGFTNWLSNFDPQNALRIKCMPNPPSKPITTQGSEIFAVPYDLPKDGGQKHVEEQLLEIIVSEMTNNPGTRYHWFMYTVNSPCAGDMTFADHKKTCLHRTINAANTLAATGSTLNVGFQQWFIPERFKVFKFDRYKEWHYGNGCTSLGQLFESKKVCQSTCEARSDCFGINMIYQSNDKNGNGDTFPDGCELFKCRTGLRPLKSVGKKMYSFQKERIKHQTCDEARENFCVRVNFYRNLGMNVNNNHIRYTLFDSTSETCPGDTIWRSKDSC